MSLGIKLDSSSHDIIVDGSGDLTLVSDVDKVGQDVKTRLKIAQGEVVLDSTYGFPFGTFFADRAVNISNAEILIKRYLLKTQGVKRLTQFLLDYDGKDSRKLKVTFSLETDFGKEINSSQYEILG